VVVVAVVLIKVVDFAVRFNLDVEQNSTAVDG
jgi:hypothetical protein